MVITPLSPPKYLHRLKLYNSFRSHRYPHISNAGELQSSLDSVPSPLKPYVPPVYYDMQSIVPSDMQYPAIYMLFQIQVGKWLLVVRSYLLLDVLYSCGRTQNFHKNRKYKIFLYLRHPATPDISAYPFRSSART